MNLQKGKNGRTFTMTLLLGFLCLGLLSPSLAQEAAQETVFRVTGGNELDFGQILANYTNGGSVSIRAQLIQQDGGVENRSSILVEKPRAGTPEFWEAVRNIVETWRFPANSIHPGAPSYLDYTFTIPGVKSDEKPLIEINCKNLVLAENTVLDFNHPELLVNVNGIENSNIVVTAAPEAGYREKSTNFVSDVGKIISQLGWFFGIIFIILLLIFIYYLIKTYKTGLKSWNPLNLKPRRKYWIAGDWVLDGKPVNEKDLFRYQENLFSREALEIRNLWENAIEVTQLPENIQYLFKYKLSRAQAENFIDFVENRLDGDFTDTKEIYTELKKKDESEEHDFFNKIIKDEDFIKKTQAFPTETEQTISKEEFLRELKKAATRTEVTDAVFDLHARVFELDEQQDRTKLQKLYREFQNLLGVTPAVRQEEIAFRKLDDVKEELKARKEVLKNLVDCLDHPTKWISMNEGEKQACRAYVWEFFGLPQLLEALGTCNEINYNNSKGKTYDLFDIFETGLNNHLVNQNEWWTSQEIDRAIDRALAVKLEERKSALDGLWSIGSVAPMVGLFGTVYGISRAFGKIGGMKNIKYLMSKLAGEINIALSTTIVGLIIGISAIIAYYLFKSRIETKGAQIQKYFTDISNKA